MKIAIIGSRDFPDLDLVRRFVTELPRSTVVVSGGARGVDQAAEGAAEACGLEVIVLKPDWDGLGKRAGLIRNEDIIDEADRVVAFWDGSSKGTIHALKLAVESNKPIRVFGSDGEELSEGPWIMSTRPW